jgi:hypothetical protein
MPDGAVDRLFGQPVLRVDTAPSAVADAPPARPVQYRTFVPAAAAQEDPSVLHTALAMIQHEMTRALLADGYQPTRPSASVASAEDLRMSSASYTEVRLDAVATLRDMVFIG